MAPAALVILSFGGTLAAAIGAGWPGIAAAAFVYIVIGCAYLTWRRSKQTEEETNPTEHVIEPARSATTQPVPPTQIPEMAEDQQAIFAAEELTDLGVSQEDIRFTADMTIEEFHEAEARFRSALPVREICWWSSADTRLRAEFTMETQFSKDSLDACEDLVAWLRLPRQAGTEKYATLEWLLHTKQGQVEAWKKASPLHQAVLHRLSDWLDDPSQDISTALLDRELIYHAIRNSIQSLEEREQQLLTMRYGLGTAAPITLEEAGQRLHVTRERVRQIEARALNRLRHPSRRLSIGLATEVTRWLLNDSPPKALVYGQPSEAARLLERQLTPMGQILLGSYSPEEQTTIAHSIGLIHLERFVLGCGASTQTAELAEAIDASVREVDPRFPLLPSAFERICVAIQGISTESIANAIGVSQSVALHAGYVVPQRPPRAVLDAVELHQRMLAAGGHVDRTFFGRRDPKLANHYPPGDLSRRDFDAAVDHPHLFMKLGDLTWLALHDQLEAHSVPAPTRGAGQHPQEFDAESRVSEIRQVVRELGFARLVSIRTQLAHIPEGSVHAIVNSRGDFERVAPGTYCITDEEVDGHEDQLLDTWHVEHYLLGRKCGEQLGSYRAWTPAVEYAWCKWARAQDPEHYPELLHFAQIDAWPLDPEDRTFWQEQVAHNARSPVAPAIYPTSDPKLPDPTELLEIILMIHADAGINQLRVNRSLGSRPRISTKWTYLAVLVAAGWLEESDSFFGWHARASSDEARAQIEANMLSERRAEGANCASSPAFVEALELALAGLQAGHCAWLRDDSRHSLIRVIQSIIQGPAEEATEPDEPALSLDSLLSDMQAKRAFDRLSGDL